jgi:hypothetical protein
MAQDMEGVSATATSFVKYFTYETSGGLLAVSGSVRATPLEAPPCACSTRRVCGIPSPFHSTLTMLYPHATCYTLLPRRTLSAC